jgi:hypothetical protein
MSKIRESAKGESCQIRSPICNGDPETVVLCHLPAMAMGGKAPDYQAAYGCSNCHDLVDGRSYQGEYFDTAQIKMWFYQAVIRTQEILVEKGLLNFED